jgi:hypothetical protein
MSTPNASDSHKAAGARRKSGWPSGVGGAKGTDISAELTAVVDDVKKVPARLMPDAGYLRASVNGPVIELIEGAWQVGWDRVGAGTAKLVAVRTARVPHVEQAIRLVAKA